MHFIVVSFLSRLLVCELSSLTFSTPEGACEQVGFTNEGRTRRVRMITLCLSEIVLEIGHATIQRPAKPKPQRCENDRQPAQTSLQAYNSV